MQRNDIITDGDTLMRILDITDSQALVIDCIKLAMPKWVTYSSLSTYILSSNSLPSLPDVNELNPILRKRAYERFTLIADVLPFITSKQRRSSVIAHISEQNKLSKQTICRYLWLYLVHQSISALAPKEKQMNRELTSDEKNIRWALNKFYYTPNKNSLNTAYTFMLKEKYCDSNGALVEDYPSFYQFRYFYRQHRKLQNFYISRDGIKSYQRNHRTLLGDGIQEFAHTVGYGMLDATICDIYLVNEAGALVGRSILTACVDAYSGLCCGYSLSWEGGVYSLRNLMLNVITDKTEWCKRFGIWIAPTDWNCNKLPATIVTDKGREYVSDTFEQISDLGVRIVNLPSFRPDLKGAVEKFFDVIQELYKPHLRGKGVIEPDFQERGKHDYRKDACLTLLDFEKIIIKCILYYNTQRIIMNFPYTEKMLNDNVKPYANCIWNYSIEQMGANLIPTDANTLIHTLLPRTTGKFTRKGLVVHGIRYKNENYTEWYLAGGDAHIAYNPDDVSEVWLLENGKYTVFSLIEQRFSGKDLSEASDIRRRQNTLKSAEKTAVLQAKIDLANYIGVIAESKSNYGSTSIQGIRENRKREQLLTHIDYVKAGNIDE